VIIDFRTADDAGVYLWDEGSALVQTVDFFTPIVDDPYVYGQIAAANALSDIYAMGARPLTALAVAGFPVGALEPAEIEAVFRGGFDKLREAGVALLGGHTVQDREVKFGYAVTGVVDPRRVWSNAAARPGDVLLLTKPLGTGVVATAIKYERAPLPLVELAVSTMLTLNKAAAEAMMGMPAGTVHACTDVTGFGLIGHAVELAEASRVTVRLEAAAVPLLPGVLDLAAANRSGGLGTNQEHFGQVVRVAPDIDADLVALLYDPQTSGGLLVSVDPQQAGQVEAALRSAGVTGVRVGCVEETSEARVVVA
jgi:selenide,water dikinase